MLIVLVVALALSGCRAPSPPAVPLDDAGVDAEVDVTDARDTSEPDLVDDVVDSGAPDADDTNAHDATADDACDVGSPDGEICYREDMSARTGLYEVLARCAGERLPIVDVEWCFPRGASDCVPAGPLVGDEDVSAFVSRDVSRWAARVGVSDVVELSPADETSLDCGLARGCPTPVRGLRTLPSFINQRPTFELDSIVEAEDGTLVFGTAQGVFAMSPAGELLWVIDAQVLPHEQVGSVPGIAAVPGSPDVVVTVHFLAGYPISARVAPDGTFKWLLVGQNLHPTIREGVAYIGNGASLAAFDSESGAELACAWGDSEYVLTVDLVAFEQVLMSAYVTGGTGSVAVFDREGMERLGPADVGRHGDTTEADPYQRVIPWFDDTFVAVTRYQFIRFRLEDGEIDVVDSIEIPEQFQAPAQGVRPYGALVVDTTGGLSMSSYGDWVEFRVAAPFTDQESVFVTASVFGKHVMQDGVVLGRVQRDLVAEDRVEFGGGYLWRMADVVDHILLRDGRLLTIHLNGDLWWWDQVHGGLADTPSPTYGFDLDRTMSAPSGPFSTAPRQIPVAWAREE